MITFKPLSSIKRGQIFEILAESYQRLKKCMKVWASEKRVDILTKNGASIKLNTRKI